MEWLDLNTLGAITGFAAAAGSGSMQFVKHFSFWKNSWCRVGSPIVSVIAGLLFLGALGYLTWNSGLKANSVALLQIIITTLAGGTSMVGLYKPLNAIGMLPAGPDNHKDDIIAANEALIAVEKAKIEAARQVQDYSKQGI